MTERTALEIADKLDYWTRSVMSIHNVPTLPKLCDCGEKAADMLRQQHAEIERLTAIIAKDGYAELWAECYTLRCEIKGPDGFETWKDAAVHERREMFKVKAEAKRLTKERDAAIAAAVNTEREAIEAIVRALPNPHDGLKLGSVIRAIRARSAT